MINSEPTRVVCNVCSRPATHYTPDGFMCPSDALLAAVGHAGEMDWLPVPLRPGTFAAADLN